MDEHEAAAARFRAALEMRDFGIAIMRQNLRRRMAAASEAEIDDALGAWLRSKPIPGHDAPHMRVVSDFPARER